MGHTFCTSILHCSVLNTHRSPLYQMKAFSEILISPINLCLFAHCLDLCHVHHIYTATRSIPSGGISPVLYQHQAAHNRSGASWFKGVHGNIMSNFIFKKKLLDQSHLCGASDFSCFGLGVSFLMGFKSRVDLSLALFLADM